MPKALIDPLVGDPIAQNNFEAIHQILNGGMGVDNFNYQVIEGTTSNTPDVETLVQHSMKPQPSFVFPLVGDVYIQNITDTFIDIRSTKKNVQFKVVCFAGPKIADETATNPDTFKDTVGIIDEETPAQGDNRPDYFNLNFTPFDGEAITGRYAGAACDGENIYVTRHNTTPGNLYKINIETGVTSKVQLNASRSVGAMYYDGTDLWVADMKSYGTSTNNVYKVNVSTFTVTSTIGCNVNLSQFTHCANVYVTSDAIYLAGRRQSGSQDGWLARCDKGSGAQQGQITGVASGSNGHKGFKKILEVGGSLYAIDGADTGEVRVTKFGGNPISATTTYISAFSKGYKAMGMTALGGNLYIPVVHGNSSSASPADHGLFSPALVKLDPTGSGTFSVFSIPAGGFQLNGATSEDKSQPFLANSISVGNFVYLVGVSNEETRLTQFDTVNETVLTGIMPLGHKFTNFTDSNSGDNTSNIMDTYLVADPSDATFYVVKNIDGASATPVLENFEYFKPDLTDFGS